MKDRQSGAVPAVERMPQTADKTLRIQTMQPDIKNKYIKFNRRHKRLLEQLVQFPMGAHDDGPDALEGCRTWPRKSESLRSSQGKA